MERGTYERTELTALKQKLTTAKNRKDRLLRQAAETEQDIKILELEVEKKMWEQSDLATKDHHIRRIERRLSVFRDIRGTAN